MLGQLADLARARSDRELLEVVQGDREGVPVVLLAELPLQVGLEVGVQLAASLDLADDLGLHERHVLVRDPAAQVLLVGVEVPLVELLALDAQALGDVVPVHAGLVDELVQELVVAEEVRRIQVVLGGHVPGDGGEESGLFVVHSGRKG